MTAATIASKHHVTIPVEVCNQAGVQAGDRIGLGVKETTGRYQFDPATRSLAALKDIVMKPAKRALISAAE